MIDVHRLGMEMRVKVAGVSVEPISADSSEAPKYRFNDLTLKITTRNVAEGAVPGTGVAQ